MKRSDRISVYWPDDAANYPGTIKHMRHDGNVTVLYDDGEKGSLDLDDEMWSPEQALVTARSSATVKPDADHPIISDNGPAVLQHMMAHCGNKTFMKHEVQAFEQYTLDKAYNAT